MAGTSAAQPGAPAEGEEPKEWSRCGGTATGFRLPGECVGYCTATYPGGRLGKPS
jgi:hypothetical protein